MQRVQCSVMCDGVRCYVIAEKNAEGDLQFWMQEPGEVRWYGFQPSAGEKEAVNRLLAAQPTGGWPLLTHTTHPEMARR